MALLAPYHSRYHAKALAPRPGNNEHYLAFTPTATTIPEVEPYVHGIANDLLPASPKRIGLYNSWGGSVRQCLVGRIGLEFGIGKANFAASRRPS